MGAKVMEVVMFIRIKLASERQNNFVYSLTSFNAIQWYKAPRFTRNIKQMHLTLREFVGRGYLGGFFKYFEECILKVMCEFF